MADCRRPTNGSAGALASNQPLLLQRLRHLVLQPWRQQLITLPLLVSSSVLLLLLLLPVSDALSIVKQLSSCSVETDAGVVDLSPLDTKSGSARFQNILSYSLPQEVHYDWNPCSNFNDGACAQVALCGVAGGQCISYGDQSSAMFSVNGSQLQLTYSNPQFQTAATVTLLCTEGTDAVSSTGDEQATIITFQFSGPHACATSGNGISTGSVLCIIFFTLAIVYFVGGCVYMRVRHQAAGLELVPNGKIWKEIPALVKEGFLCSTTACGLTKRPGYGSV